MNAVVSHMADWLTSTRRGNLILWLLEMIAFAVGALVTLLVLFLLETRLFPVVNYWKIDYIQKHDNVYVVGGVLNKARACELIATTVMAVPKNGELPRTAIYQIKPTDILGGNVPTGNSVWGPWKLPIPTELLQKRDTIDRLEVIGTHRCHMAWSQESLYGTIPMERLP